MATKSKTPNRKAKPRKAELLPTKAALEGLKSLRIAFRDVFETYWREMEGGLAEVTTAVTKVSANKARSKDRARDLSEMLVLLRGLNVKPAKGRRRDLKKIETTVGDMREIIARW
ncbi:MAG: hypothetical protein ABI680_17695 [Chthoniobacteraceae bacterium]